VAEKALQYQQSVSKHEEQILVVPREKLFEGEAWHGLHIPQNTRFVDRVLEHKEFQPRGAMEEDTRYKQIIPYLVFHHGGKLFLMQRASTSNEQRLKNTYSVGIGGHIRKEDMQTDNILDWAHREFHEEVSYNGTIHPTFLGILNDDTNDVGQVHAAFVYLLHGDSADIHVTSELQSGTLVSLPGCLEYRDWLESWSQIVLDTLQTHAYITE